MNENIYQRCWAKWRIALGRLVVILSGVVLGQVVLYGPCLIGKKILLPLDTLAQPGVYIPRTAKVVEIEEQDPTLCDLVYFFEPARRFAISELNAGRLPRWIPGQFAGAPFVWPMFSPFAVIETLVESPVILAWTSLMSAVVAGLGAFAFCQRVLRVGFWPAVVAAWCYPLTGFLVLWQGYGLSMTVCWLPWLLVAVHQTVRQRSRFAIAGLSVATLLVLGNRQIDVAGQVLMVSGFFGLWTVWDEFGREWFSTRARRAISGLIVGWSLGFMLASPHVLPLLEYGRTGHRMVQRSEGVEERPPAGMRALPQVVSPDFYGRRTHDSLQIAPFPLGSPQESAAGAYAGIIAMLFAAPLAFWSQRHRSISLFFGGLAFLGSCWWLNVPLLVDILRMPGLNMMSHNRLVFATSFSFLVLTAIGLESFLSGTIRWRRWHWALVLPIAGLCGWSCFRSFHLQEALAIHLPSKVSQGYSSGWVQNLDDVRRVQEWFSQHYLAAGIIGGIGVIFWFLVSAGKPSARRLFPFLTVALLGELFWFGHGRRPQCDPELYYPGVPALEQTTHAEPPGRVIGYSCLPANVANATGLRDIRGCDGVDPARLIALLTPTVQGDSFIPEYAFTQWMMPKADFTPGGDIKLPPILDMMNVRYVVFRGAPPVGLRPRFQSFDYFVLENPNALPRAFVPRRIETVMDDNLRLHKLGLPDFDARNVAFIEEEVELQGDCYGTAEIADETPTGVRLKVQMETPGLMVLTDLWEKGWKALVNGQRVPILRTNHAIRGVVLPKGDSTLEFRYEPASFRWGCWLATTALVTMTVWLGAAVWARPMKSAASARQ